MKKKYFVAACPHHMHARPNNSSYGNRGGPREAIEAKKGILEIQTDMAFAAPTFLSLHRLHLTFSRLNADCRVGIAGFLGIFHCTATAKMSKCPQQRRFCCCWMYSLSEQFFHPALLFCHRHFQTTQTALHVVLFECMTVVYQCTLYTVGCRV